MISMTLPDMAAVVDGVVHDDHGQPVTGPAFVDSRIAELGGLFVALVGERADGHDFAAAAVAAGAAGVLGTRPLGVPTVVVDDALSALGRLARHVVGSLEGMTVVGITGSQGKTGTKDIVAQLLAEAGTTVATQGSLNNEIGLPLTVLRAGPDTKYLVLEMGSRGVGHLRYLCDISRPDVALVLNVGKAHLGEFGTQAEIARAKGELVEALDEDGTAVLNADDPLVAGMAVRTEAQVLTFGKDRPADVQILDLRVDERGRPHFELAASGVRHRVRLPLLGEHQARNAAAAAAVATAVGMPLGQVATALGRVRATSRWRMELHELEGGVTVVNDSYNANPDSMRAALETVAAMGRRQKARTVAVLGEMRELGESSRAEHQSVGRLAVRLNFNQLLVVGEAAEPIHEGARLEGSLDETRAEGSVFVKDSSEALAWIEANLAPGDVVLFKASRAAGLEQLAQAVIDKPSGWPSERAR